MSKISETINELKWHRDTVQDLVWRYRQVDFTTEDWRDQNDSVWEKWCEDWLYTNDDFLEWDRLNAPEAPNIQQASILLLGLNEVIARAMGGLLPIMEAFRQAIEQISMSMGIPSHFFEDVEPSSRSAHPRRRQ